MFDSGLARIILKAEQETGEDLSDIERFKLRVRLESTLSLLESKFLQYEAGVINARDLSKFDRLFRHIASNAKEHGIWDADTLAEGFVTHVEKLLGAKATKA